MDLSYFRITLFISRQSYNLLEKHKYTGNYKPLSKFQVDKHIRRLDSDLARFESEIQDKALSNTRNQEETETKKRKYAELS